MTVCIAAICAFGEWQNRGYMVVGASDRMLSGPDIQFEPPQAKIYTFTSMPSSIALVAGDPYAQSSICVATNRHIDALPVAKRPQTVEELAVVYAEKFSAHRRSVAETTILKPHGLDANSFMDRQQDFRADVVAGLMRRMEDHRLEVETIITGVDASGPHIFVITDPGQIACADSMAFASIGTGKHHADSQFMQAQHTREVDWTRALFSTYVAKKRAELAPTVGRRNTDLFSVSQNGYRHIVLEIQERLRALCDDLEERTRRETDFSYADAQAILTEIVNRPPPPLTPPEPSPASREAVAVFDTVKKPPRPKRKKAPPPDGPKEKPES